MSDLAQLVAREVTFLAEVPICTVLLGDEGECTVYVPGASAHLFLRPLEAMSLEDYAKRFLAPIIADLKRGYLLNGYVPEFGAPEFEKFFNGREGCTAVLNRAAT